MERKYISTPRRTEKIMRSMHKIVVMGLYYYLNFGDPLIMDITKETLEVNNKTCIRPLCSEKDLTQTSVVWGGYLYTSYKR